MIEIILAKITSDLSTIDILINNAGIVVNKSFEAISWVEWQRIFQVNFFGPMRLIRDLLPQLRRARRAHVVNIGSIGGFQGSVKFKGLSAYSASKAALANLTESLAVEFADDQISINCLCPGSVSTPMFAEAFSWTRRWNRHRIHG